MKINTDTNIPDHIVHKKRLDRGAFLDKKLTKTLPGTMEALRKIANEATDNHMSYGKYVAMKKI